MKIFNFSTKTWDSADSLPDKIPSPLALVCSPHEVFSLCPHFGWSAETVNECTGLDENVRHQSYNGYDFLSLMHITLGKKALSLREVNVYFSKDYFVAVTPTDCECKLASTLERFLENSAEPPAEEPLTWIYYRFLDYIISDIADLLEKLEDRMDFLSEQISFLDDVSEEISIARHFCYTIKKHTRALSYIGPQLLADENSLISGRHVRYFKSIETRLHRFFDFSAQLSDFSSQLLQNYDSFQAAKTNAAVNKLTVITLFFAPLTLITGIYGMNFKYMPELGFRWGYLLSLTSMAAVTALVFWILKKKKWL